MEKSHAAVDLPVTLERSSPKAQRTYAKTLLSAEQQYGPRSAARRNRGETYGGVDGIGHTRAELYRRAAALGIRGRSTMRKAELAKAIGDQQKP